MLRLPSSSILVILSSSPVFLNRSLQASIHRGDDPLSFCERLRSKRTPPICNLVFLWSAGAVYHQTYFPFTEEAIFLNAAASSKHWNHTTSPAAMLRLLERKDSQSEFGFRPMMLVQVPTISMWRNAHAPSLFHRPIFSFASLDSQPLYFSYRPIMPLAALRRPNQSRTNSSINFRDDAFQTANFRELLLMMSLMTWSCACTFVLNK